ncbi:MAG: hypothetical protein U1E76_22330 [Planctomycetota bacterium]
MNATRTGGDRIVRARRERAIITLAALGIVVPLVLLTFAFLSIATYRLHEHGARAQAHTADALANSGIDMTITDLMANPAFDGGSATLEDGAVVYDVVDRWTDSSSTFLRVVARGFTNPRTVAGELADGPGSVASVLTAIVRERTFDYDLREAIFLQDPDVTLTLNGNAFLFDGNDKDYTTGNPGADGARPAITSLASPNDIKQQISKKQWDNVKGLGGSPSIAQRSDSTLVADLIEFYKASASLRLTGDTHLNDADLGDAAKDDFKVTYVTGTLKLSGSSKGAGMLLVVGDLDISGSFAYTGIVAVLGRVVFSGGGGNDQKMIDGSLLIGDDMSTGGLRVNGNITVQYSSQAVARAKKLSGRYSVEAIMRGRVQ